MPGVILVLTFMDTLLDGLYGLTIENQYIVRFSKQLSIGKYLFMIDMAQRHKSTMKRLVKRHEGGQQRGAGLSIGLMDVKRFPMT